MFCRSLAVSCSVALLFSSGFAANWEWVNPCPMGGSFRSIAAVSSQEAWALTLGGSAIIHTTDGGQNWEIQHVNADLYELGMVNDQFGWASGELGLILTTTDGGIAWVRRYPATDEHFFGSYFLDSQHGWAVGYRGQIFVTTDGGENWEPQESGETHNLYDVFFTDAEHGWIAGGWYPGQYATLLKTTNGGQTWDEIENTIAGNGSCVHFVDAIHGFLGTGAGLYRSGDGGETWEHIAELPDSGFNAIEFFDTQTGWIGAAHGMIFQTTDGGASWTERLLMDTTRTTDLSFVDSNSGWVAGQNFLYHTDNGGASWESHVRALTRGQLYSVSCVDSLCAWIAGVDDERPQPGRMLLQTVDGGANWTRLPIDPNQGFSVMEFVDRQMGFAVRGDTDIDWGPQWGEVLRTTDGGITWDVLYHVEQTALRYLSIRGNHLWAAGEGAMMIFSFDGGETWHETAAPHSMVSGLSFADEWNGLASSEYHSPLRTTDGGQTWIDTGPLPLQRYWEDVYYLDAANAWLAGGSVDVDSADWFFYGTILHTSDGGMTWEIQVDHDFYWLSRVHFPDRNHGFAFGGDAIASTTDGGATWTRENIGIRWSMNDIAFSPAGLGYIVGLDGTILRYAGEPLDIPPVTNPPLPGSFSLTAFPNPFNASVTLHYSLPLSGPTRLTIFDLQGREVQTIVDQMLFAGDHSAQFSAAELPSGIYFARLSSRGADVTRKLVLLR